MRYILFMIMAAIRWPKHAVAFVAIVIAVTYVAPPSLQMWVLPAALLVVLVGLGLSAPSTTPAPTATLPKTPPPSARALSMPYEEAVAVYRSKAPAESQERADAVAVLKASDEPVTADWLEALAAHGMTFPQGITWREWFGHTGRGKR